MVEEVQAPQYSSDDVRQNGLRDGPHCLKDVQNGTHIHVFLREIAGKWANH